MIEWGIFHQIFSTAIDLVYLFLVLGTVIVIVMDNRNPVKTLAWLLVLIFVPLLGLVLYFFFGRKDRKARLISRSRYTRLTRHPMEEFQAQKAFKYPQEQYQLMYFFYNINHALSFADNQIEIYTDGESMLLSLLKEINKAKHHIHVEFFKFEDDPIGRLVRDALIDKAKQGVEVRVIYDDVGCWKVGRDFFQVLLEGGVEVRDFLKVRFPLFTSKVNYRNHRKVVVIDGRIGFTGGMNLALRYVRGVSWGVWRDTHVKIVGKAVYGLQTVFLTDWYAMDRTLITSSEYFPEISSKGNALIQIVTSDPIGDWRNIMQGLLMAITNARSYFYIQTPYFLPTESIQMALKTAALAGVDVRIMIPRKADTILTHYASFSYLDDIIRAGIKVYFYEKGFLHSKMMVSDDQLSTIGSTNMDFRSLEYDFEVNAFMYDKQSALACKNIFLKDLESSSLLNSKMWERRSKRQKLVESILRLISPLL
ncbi:MAG: cardiolipin synthase [Phocaeicola sp.]|uniref:cardiolipin synthase n=2 Tax=Bacteroidaceae TaxID=815 RepID=UPI00234F75E8|nr:cardiolipin synthase [Phocaeicola oris]MCE2616792.1 cardiolipin synthase [Phocaeicola oris]